MDDIEKEEARTGHGVDEDAEGRCHDGKDDHADAPPQAISGETGTGARDREKDDKDQGPADIVEPVIVLEGHGLDPVDIVKIPDQVVEHHKGERASPQEIEFRDPALGFCLIIVHTVYLANQC